jgi:hypothetical protein
VVRDRSAEQLFSTRPMSIGDSIARALSEDDQKTAATHWYDALASSGDPTSWAGVRFGNRFVDSVPFRSR